MDNLLDKIRKILSNRQFILSFITVCISVIYISYLFNLQVIHGAEYRESSQKKMLRTVEITANRGEITDRHGVVLATSKLSYNAEIYKVTCTSEELNSAVLDFYNILESNGDSIYTTFPINEELNDYNFTSLEAEKKWKNEVGMKENYTFEDTINAYTKRYELENYSLEDRIKIILVRYEAGIKGYSLFKSVLIAEDISEASFATIEEKKSSLCGIQTTTSVIRYYPEKELTSHITGYVSKITQDEYNELKDKGYTYNSYTGKTGIELTFEKYLKGEDGIKKVEVDTYGNISNEYITKEAVSGNTITLTIDYRLQKKAEEALENVMNEIRTGSARFIQHEDAESGAVVVLDVNTGEILAMVSYPGYDPNEFVKGIKVSKWNEYNTSTSRPMYNRVTNGLYSPGSTYKMSVALAGLKSGAITEDELIEDRGRYQYGYNPKCWIFDRYGLTHGFINVSTAIQVSCNCYFYEVGRRAGIAEIVEMSRMLGLDSKTGIELAHETTGNIAGSDTDMDWYLGDTLSAAIGQSYNSFTPIGMARYIAAVANGGTVRKVTLLKNIEDENQNSVSSDELDKYIEDYTGVKNESYNIDVAKEKMEAVRGGMLAVTQVGGTSYNVFRDLGISVAGKTGTAEVSSGSSDGLFVGFAPYDNPEIAIIAVIEHGGEGTYVANVVRPIIDEYFRISGEEKQNEKNPNIEGIKIEF